MSVDFGKSVTDISLAEKKVEVTTQEGKKEAFDGIILTLPIPQASL